jgi:hypothetical protein
LYTEAIIDDIRPSRHIDPQQKRILIIMVVEILINLKEDTSNVADDDNQNEQSIEDVINDVKGGTYITKEVPIMYDRKRS